MLGRTLTASWENFSIVSTKSDWRIPPSKLVPVVELVEREEESSSTTRKVARRRVMETVHRVDLFLPLGTTTWETETSPIAKQELLKPQCH